MVCGVLERGRRRVVYPCSDREGSQALGLRIRRTHPHRGRLGSGSCFGQEKCTSLCWFIVSWFWGLRRSSGRASCICQNEHGIWGAGLSFDEPDDEPNHEQNSLVIIVLELLFK